MALQHSKEPSSRRRKRPLASSSAGAVASVVLLSSCSVAWLVTGVSASDDNNNTAPGGGVPCGPSLECFNGGSCEQGNASWPGDDISFGSSEPGLPPSLQQNNQDGYFCACLNNNTGDTKDESFTGLSCEIPFRECQYSNGFAVCYHGGSCFDDDPPDWNQETPVCNCETAQHEGQSYKGRNCELLVVATTNPCQVESPYCFNGGTCQEVAAEESQTNGGSGGGLVANCTCTNGFSGPRCETPPKQIDDENNGSDNNSMDPQPPPPPPSSECTLECHHGGTCQFATDNEGLADQILAGHWYGTLNDMFCKCPEGFAGIQCEHLAEMCGDQEWICLHGSTCHQNGDDKTSDSWQCLCPEDPNDYKGGVCASPSAEGVSPLSLTADHTRVEHCSPMEEAEYAHSMAVPAFCFNGGTCKDQVVDGLLMPGCDCPPAFAGPHCEFVRSASDGLGPGVSPVPPDENDEGSRRRAGRVFVNLVLVLLLGAGALWLARYGYRAYQAHKRRDQVVLNLQSFREENQGAVSANGSMLFPSMTNTDQHRAGDSQFTLSELMHDVEIT